MYRIIIIFLLSFFCLNDSVWAQKKHHEYILNLIKEDQNLFFDENINQVNYNCYQNTLTLSAYVRPKVLKKFLMTTRFKKITDFKILEGCDEETGDLYGIIWGDGLGIKYSYVFGANAKGGRLKSKKIKGNLIQSIDKDWRFLFKKVDAWDEEYILGLKNDLLAIYGGLYFISSKISVLNKDNIEYKAETIAFDEFREVN